MSISITLEGQIAKLEDLLNQAKALKQISAAVSAIDKQNELMGFKIQRVESKRVDEFENMSDEELRQYIYGFHERAWGAVERCGLSAHGREGGQGRQICELFHLIPML